MLVTEAELLVRTSRSRLDEITAFKLNDDLLAARQAQRLDVIFVTTV